MIYIFWTCRDLTEAKTIIRGLLEERLIACASIFPKVESIYRWQGKIEEGQEVKVILKTAEHRFEAIERYVKERCSYEVPELLQVDIAKGFSSYLSWIFQEVN